MLSKLYNDDLSKIVGVFSRTEPLIESSVYEPLGQTDDNSRQGNQLVLNIHWLVL